MNQALRKLAIRQVPVLLLAFLCFENALAQEFQPLQAITYHLSMPRPASHLFEVTIEVDLAASPTTKSLTLQMPRWSPGRYAIFDFAKNVQQFQAYTSDCRHRPEAPSSVNCRVNLLPVRRLDNQTWQIERVEKQRVTAHYKVFGNDLSGTFSQLDTRHANFNGASIFMYLAEHKAHPVKLVIEPPAGWRIINGRMERADQREWLFPNWDEMVDTPTEIAPDWSLDQFQVAGKPYKVVVHSFGAEGGKRPALVRDIERIVRAQIEMWGQPDFDSYTFLIHFAGDDHSGDGMEHLNSTQIIEPGTLADADTYEDTLVTVAHEFFHVWNVKRLRPVELGPWDFTRPVNTRALWIAEGFTNYYGHLMMRRAGLWDETKFLKREALTINLIENSAGARLMSAEESSLLASFLDDAPHAQRTNLENTSISYYPKGELLGLVLDLIIRGRTKGRASLDDVFKRLYEDFYVKSANSSYYLRGRGYTVEDFENAVTAVAGAELGDFFQRYVRDVTSPPYTEAFGFVGLKLVRRQAREPYNAGISLEWEDPQGLTIENVRSDSVAERAGLQAGDQIVSLAGKPARRETWLLTLAGFKPKDSVPIVVRRDRRTIKSTLVLGEAERFEYLIEEDPGATAEQKTLRAAWLRKAN